MKSYRKRLRKLRKSKKNKRGGGPPFTKSSDESTATPRGDSAEELAIDTEYMASAVAPATREEVLDYIGIANERARADFPHSSRLQDLARSIYLEIMNLSRGKNVIETEPELRNIRSKNNIEIQKYKDKPDEDKKLVEKLIDKLDSARRKRTSSYRFGKELSETHPSVRSSHALSGSTSVTIRPRPY